MVNRPFQLQRCHIVTLPNILSDDYLDEIRTVEKNDPTYYKWLYLGQVVGLGNSIYNMNLFHKLNEIPEDDDLVELYFSQDSGQQTSATTEMCVGLTQKNKVVLLDTYYYSPAGKAVKKAPSDFAKELFDLETKWIDKYGMQPTKRSADSATSDFALDHEFFKRYNTHYHHVAKKEKTMMIDNVQNLLSRGRFY